MKIWFENGCICMETDGGKKYSRPLEFFPALKDAADNERNNFKINKYGDAVRWEAIDEDIHISSLMDNSQLFTGNIIGEIFSRFPQLNVSEVARTMGIHKSLLSKYIYGSKKPSEQRTAEILNTLRALGKKLAEL